MAALRADEIVAREAFLQTHLPNLPPVFVEVRTHDTCLSFFPVCLVFFSPAVSFARMEQYMCTLVVVLA